MQTLLKLNFINKAAEVWWVPARQRRRSSQFQVISVICLKLPNIYSGIEREKHAWNKN